MSSLWMLVASFLFACMGVCVKLGADAFSAGELVFYRGFIGIFMMAAIAGLKRISLRTPVWRLQLLRGVSGATALLLYFYAITALPLATAVTLNYTSPIFVALLLIVWFREKIGLRAGAVLALGFVGVVFLLKPTLNTAQLPAAAAGLLSGLLAAVSYSSLRELGHAGEPEARTVFWFSVVVVALGLPWMVARGFHYIGGAEALILLGVGVFAGAAQLALTRAYTSGKTLVTANLSYTTVVFSSLAGIALWQEWLPFSGWLGMVLIVASGIGVSLLHRRET